MALQRTQQGNGRSRSLAARPQLSETGVLGADDGVRLASIGRRLIATAVDLLVVALVALLGSILLETPIGSSYPAEIVGFGATNRQRG